MMEEEKGCLCGCESCSCGPNCGDDCKCECGCDCHAE